MEALRVTESLNLRLKALNLSKPSSHFSKKEKLGKGRH